MANNCTIKPAQRPIEEIQRDILEIKTQLANVNQNERIDDLSITYRSVDELKDILKSLEDELCEASGGSSQKQTFGRRRGFGTWR